MSFPWWLSFCVGFLSLSQEILFVRVISFAQGGTPPAFALVLTLYLLGIAGGAAVGKAICARWTALHVPASLALLLAAVTDPLTPLLGRYIGLYDGANLVLNGAVTVVLIVLAAAIKSVLFPIAHHMGSQSSGPRIGRSVSKIYFGNILGSTLGPIVTGYVLLELLSTDECFNLLGLASLALALVTAWGARERTRLVPAQALGAALVAVGVSANMPGGFVHRAAKVESAAGHAEPGAIAQMIENRHGIIHTVHQPSRADDVVLGGNMFDGRISIDTRHDSNGINRVYLLAGLHPSPSRVLMIGFSAGAWTGAIRALDGVAHIDAIDINHGYLTLMARYPLVAPLLSDPRVSFHVDDGRRWLKRHLDERFDLIIVNNTHHYRAYATSLLSAEFMAEARRHLKPGGILTINSTNSLDVALTALRSFDHVYRHRALIVMSDHDPRPSPEVARRRFEALELIGQPRLADADFLPDGAGARLVKMASGLAPVSALFAKGPGVARVVTDANLVIEYRHGQRLDVPPLRWLLPTREMAKIVD